MVALAGITPVDTNDICDLPYPVTIPIRTRIESVQDAIKSGRATGPVTVARVGEKIYPVDKLDVLHAYRKSGSRAILCMVMDAATLAEAQLLHIELSGSLSVNPLILGNAVDYVRAEGGGSMTAGAESWEHMRIARMPLVPEIRERMSGYITSLGARMEHIPSFLAVFRVLSRISDGSQVEAMELIIEYCDKMAKANRHYAVPEINILDAMTENFTQRKERPLAVRPDSYRGDDGYGETSNGSRDTRGYVDPDEGVKVREGKKKLGYYHTVDPNSVHFKCKRDNEYVFNGRSLTVREHVDKGRFILLEGDHGSRMYAIRPDAADYLELSMQPSIQYYFTSNKQHGATVIITKKNLSEETLDKIKAILRGA